MPNITKRKDSKRKPWRARIELNGKQVSRHFATKDEADSWLLLIEKEFSQTHHKADGETKTLKEGIETYKQLRLPSLKDVRNRSRILDWWILHLGHRMAADVARQPALVRESLGMLVGKQPSTINSYNAALSAVFRFLGPGGVGWVASNPCKYLDREKVKNDDRATPITQSQFRACLAACSQVTEKRHMRALLIILGTTGVRRGEALGATWDDYDLDDGLLHIRDSKNDEQRVVALHPSAVEALQALPKRSEQPFSHFSDDSKLWDPYKTWVKVRAIADLTERVRLHDIRHSFGVWSIDAGVGLRELQAVFGHSVPQMTARYTRLSARHNQQAQAKVFDALGDLGGSDE